MAGSEAAFLEWLTESVSDAASALQTAADIIAEPDRGTGSAHREEPDARDSESTPLMAGFALAGLAAIPAALPPEPDPPPLSGAPSRTTASRASPAPGTALHPTGHAVPETTQAAPDDLQSGPPQVTALAGENDGAAPALPVESATSPMNAEPPEAAQVMPLFSSETELRVQVTRQDAAPRSQPIGEAAAGMAAEPIAPPPAELPSEPVEDVADAGSAPDTQPAGQTNGAETTRLPLQKTESAQFSGPDAPPHKAPHALDDTAAALSPSTGGIELSLEPEELGRLTLTLHSDGDRIHAQIRAESADTLDLLRRNAEQLLVEFKAAGYRHAEMQFGHWGQDRPRAHPAPSPPGTTPPDAASDAPDTHTRQPRRRHAGLDLRL